ncbi:MAG: ribonuclease Z [Candidatus Pacearchaeota archaeon]|jgi:ribonuclease Z
MIEIVFLGTGSAVPTVRRNHPSVFLRYKTENILFDCGEGTQKQFRKAGLNPCKLTRLFISHWHGDHILGIPGLLQTLALNDYPRELEIYGPKGTRDYMEKILSIFVHIGKIKIKVKEISSGIVLDTEDFQITAQEMIHDAPCLAYAFIEKDKIKIDKKKLEKLKIPNGPIIGNLKQGKDITINGKKIKAKDLIFKQEGKKIVIVTDTKTNLDIDRIAKDSNLLICESTYLDEEDLAKEYKHMTATQAAQIAKRVGTKKLVLTHFSQKHENNVKELLTFAKKYFKETVIAEDMMKINV